MRTVTIRSESGERGLMLDEHPEPAPKPGELLVAVQASRSTRARRARP